VGAHVLFGFRMMEVVEWQKHLLRTYHSLLRAIPKVKPVAGLIRRNRLVAPGRCSRAQRTEDSCKAGHAVLSSHGWEACLRCGRTTRARRQGRLQQWRRPCHPLERHRKAMALGHSLVWAASAWECATCAGRGKQLVQVMCSDHQVRVPRGTGTLEGSCRGQKRLTSFWGKGIEADNGSACKKFRSGLRSTQLVSGQGPLRPEEVGVLRKAAMPRKPSVKPRESGGRGRGVQAVVPCKGAGSLHAYFKPRM
jgi:hypothetical protein